MKEQGVSGGVGGGGAAGDDTTKLHHAWAHVDAVSQGGSSGSSAIPYSTVDTHKLHSFVSSLPGSSSSSSSEPRVSLCGLLGPRCQITHAVNPTSLIPSILAELSNHTVLQHTVLLQYLALYPCTWPPTPPPTPRSAILPSTPLQVLQVTPTATGVQTTQSQPCTCASSACACWRPVLSSPAGRDTTSTAEQTCCSECTQF